MAEPLQRPPSGEQIEIRSGDQRAVIVEVGGGLRQYTLGDRHVIDGFSALEMASSGRGQVLLPWPNRIEDGSYEFEGGTHQLALTEPARHNANHGLVRWATWTLADRGHDWATMRYALHPQPGYPFSLDVQLTYRLSAGGLSVSVTSTNAGTQSCPYGNGFHPYLTLGASSIDSLQLTLPAHSVLRSDERGIPTGSMGVDATPFDFREPRQIGALKLDHAFTDFDRDAAGLVQAQLVGPSGERVSLWADGSYEYLMVFTGDTLAIGARRGLAIEPMTCPPNAFRSGEGLIKLAPGQSHTSTWGIRPELA